MPLSDTTSCDKMKRDIALLLYPKNGKAAYPPGCAALILPT